MNSRGDLTTKSKIQISFMVFFGIVMVLSLVFGGALYKNQTYSYEDLCHNNDGSLIKGTSCIYTDSLPNEITIYTYLCGIALILFLLTVLGIFFDARGIKHE